MHFKPNLSLANKNLLTISFILYTESKISPNNRILLNRVLRPILLYVPLASCFLINLNFLLRHRAHYNNNNVYCFTIISF